MSEGVEAVADATLVGLRSHFNGQGWALDVASGRGANAIFLSGLGYRAVALDCSEAGLQLARRAARKTRLYAVVADVDRFSWPQEKIALLSVVKYLNRGIFEHLKSAVCPGGLLFYKTFNRNHLHEAPNFRAQFTLYPGELREIFGAWAILAGNDTPDNQATHSYLLVQKPLV